MIYAQGQKGASIFSLFFVRAMALHAAGDAAGERERERQAAQAAQTGELGDGGILRCRQPGVHIAQVQVQVQGRGVHCLEAAGRCLCEGMRVCGAGVAGEYCMSEGWFCSRRNRYGAGSCTATLQGYVLAFE